LDGPKKPKLNSAVFFFFFFFLPNICSQRISLICYLLNGWTLPSKWGFINVYVPETILVGQIFQFSLIKCFPLSRRFLQWVIQRIDLNSCREKCYGY
jgi:hypothetical protein